MVERRPQPPNHAHRLSELLRRQRPSPSRPGRLRQGRCLRRTSSDDRPFPMAPLEDGPGAETASRPASSRRLPLRRHRLSPSFPGTPSIAPQSFQTIPSDPGTLRPPMGRVRLRGTPSLAIFPWPSRCWLTMGSPSIYDRTASNIISLVSLFVLVELLDRIQNDGLHIEACFSGSEKAQPLSYRFDFVVYGLFGLDSV